MYATSKDTVQLLPEFFPDYFRHHTRVLLLAVEGAHDHNGAGVYFPEIVFQCSHRLPLVCAKVT